MTKQTSIKDIKDIKRLLASTECISAPYWLIKAIGADCAIVYCWLIQEFKKSKLPEMCMSIEHIQEHVSGTLSAFKQRAIFNRLSRLNLLSVKYGQSKSRYITLNQDPEPLYKLMQAKEQVSITKALKTLQKEHGLTELEMLNLVTEIANKLQNNQ